MYMSSSPERPHEDPEGHQPEKEERKRRKENGEMSPVGDMTDHGDGHVHPVTRLPLKRVENVSPLPPSANCFLIYPQQRETPYGHAAVIVEVLPSAIRIAEQNFNFNYWMKDYAREIPLLKRDGRYFIEDEYEVYGWMTIDDPPTPDDKDNEDVNQRNIQINSSSSSSSPSSSSSSHFVPLLFVLHCLGSLSPPYQQLQNAIPAEFRILYFLAQLMENVEDVRDFSSVIRMLSRTLNTIKVVWGSWL